MSRRAPLPPPPPPVEIRSWPDREAMLADRAVILGELVRLHVGPGRLGLLGMWAALAAIGWSLVGSGIIMFEQALDLVDFTSVVGGSVSLVLGAAVFVPAAVFFWVGALRDRKVRVLLASWGALDRDPERDRRLRMPGMSLTWLLLSFALGAAGLALCVIGPASARPGRDTYGLVVLVMGVGMIAWLTALTGAVTALAHRRWVLGALRGSGTGTGAGAASGPEAGAGTGTGTGSGAGRLPAARAGGSVRPPDPARAGGSVGAPDPERGGTGRR